MVFAFGKLIWSFTWECDCIPNEFPQLLNPSVRTESISTFIHYTSSDILTHMSALLQETSSVHFGSLKSLDSWQTINSEILTWPSCLAHLDEDKKITWQCLHDQTYGYIARSHKSLSCFLMCWYIQINTTNSYYLFTLILQQCVMQSNTKLHTHISTTTSLVT